nr:translation initiation factor IF-2-like [Manis javanica]
MVPGAQAKARDSRPLGERKLALTSTTRPLGAWPPAPPPPTSGTPGEPDPQGSGGPRPAPSAAGTGRKGAADLTTLGSGRGRRRRARNPGACGNSAEGVGLRPRLALRAARPPAPNSGPRAGRTHGPAPPACARARRRTGDRAGGALTWTRAAAGVSRTSRGGARPARRLLLWRPRLPPRPDSARLSRRHVPTSRPLAGQALGSASGGPRPAVAAASDPREVEAARPRGSRERVWDQPGARGRHPSCRAPLAARTPRPLRPARPPPVGRGPPSSQGGPRGGPRPILASVPGGQRA